jgi:hypothetical protein
VEGRQTDHGRREQVLKQPSAHNQSAQVVAWRILARNAPLPVGFAIMTRKVKPSLSIQPLNAD